MIQDDTWELAKKVGGTADGEALDLNRDERILMMYCLGIALGVLLERKREEELRQVNDDQKRD